MRCSECLVVINMVVMHAVGYIRRTDGLSGCFVGLAPKLVGTVVAVFGSERVAKRLGYGEIVDRRKSETLSDSEL